MQGVPYFPFKAPAVLVLTVRSVHLDGDVIDEVIVPFFGGKDDDLSVHNFICEGVPERVDDDVICFF